MVLLRGAAAVMLGTGGLQAISVISLGAGQAGMAGLLPVIAAIGVAAGLLRGWRWLAWLAMMAAIVAIGFVLGRPGGAPGPALLSYLIAAGYALFAVLVFAALWRGRPAPAPDRSEAFEIR